MYSNKEPKFISPGIYIEEYDINYYAFRPKSINKERKNKILNLLGKNFTGK